MKITITADKGMVVIGKADGKYFAATTPDKPVDLTASRFVLDEREMTEDEIKSASEKKE
jgi:hypothetical protein